MTFLEQLAAKLGSPEVIAVVIGGAGGWAFRELGLRKNEAREREAELGRLKFKQENFEATRLAVREGLGEFQKQINPVLENLADAVATLERRVEDIDKRADLALQTALVIEKSQAEWLKRAESEISTILSSEGSRTELRGLFREPHDEP